MGPLPAARGAWAADASGRTYDHVAVRDTDGSLGSVQFGRDRAAGQVIEACVAIPTRLIAEQSQPWSRWHEHPALREVHLWQTDVTQEFVRSLATLETVR